MASDQEHEFPHWEQLYERQSVESMPWLNPELDQDVKEAVENFGSIGGSILDIGTGPGTQAMQLARRGFDVTATDVSGAAIDLARTKAEGQGIKIVWKQD